jgi:hypothetical protein
MMPEGAGRKVVRVPKDERDPAKLCIRLNIRGEPCGAYRIKGGTMCARHSTKLIKQKAEQRYWDLLPHALTELVKVLRETDVADANKVRAIRDIVDRTLGPVKQHLDVEVLQQWEDTFEGVTWAKEEGEDDAEAELLALRAEVKQLRAITAGRVQTSGDVLEGRAVQPGEAGYGPDYGPLGAA